MEKILVPIDFSPASHNAAKYAVSLARVFNAHITLLYVNEPPLIMDEVSAASLFISNAERMAGYEAEMDREIKRLSACPLCEPLHEFGSNGHGIQHLPRVRAIKIEGLVREGFASDIIAETARETNAEVIVMGIKGKGKSYSVFGSTTTITMRKTSTPVLVVPANAVYRPIHQIALAADFGSGTQMNRYTLLQEVAEKYNSYIEVLSVQKRELAAASQEVIGKMKTSLAFSKFHRNFHTIRNNNIVEGINKFIEKNSSDILAMVARRHTLLGKVSTSVYTRFMSHETKIPLLVLQH